MKENEVRILADAVLTPILGLAGFLTSDVKARTDHHGEEALYVTLHFRSDAEVASGKAYIHASEAVLDALLERGEHRYPYLKYDYPDGGEAGDPEDLRAAE